MQVAMYRLRELMSCAGYSPDKKLPQNIVPANCLLRRAMRIKSILRPNTLVSILVQRNIAPLNKNLDISMGIIAMNDGKNPQPRNRFV